MARVIMDPKLFLENPSNHGRGPDSSIQAIGNRPTVEDVAQLLSLPCGQLARSSRALPFQQALHAMGLILRQPFGNFGTRGLQNFRQLSAGASLGVQHHRLQTFGHAVSAISFSFLGESNQPLISARMQSQDSWKHATLLETVWHV